VPPNSSPGGVGTEADIQYKKDKNAQDTYIRIHGVYTWHHMRLAPMLRGWLVVHRSHISMVLRVMRGNVS
jgi:hypothetical protein